MDVRVLDLFAGAGGFSLGFKMGNFKISLAIESFPKIAETYIKNFPDTEIFVKNIRKVTGREILDAVGEIDVVIGGPPCIAYTARNPKRKERARDRLLKDSIGSLVLEFFRIVREIKPQVYVMENVAGLMDVQKELEKIIQKIGYNAYFHLWRCENYGLPSIRKRVFVSNIKLNAPEERRVSSWDALKKFRRDLPNSEYPKIPKKYIAKVENMRFGESLVTFRGADGIKKNWIKINPRKTAPPITATSRFIHPYEPRGLSVREHALLMTFPNSFVFYGSEKIKFTAVGDAVPPLIARHIAREIRKKME